MARITNSRRKIQLQPPALIGGEEHSIVMGSSSLLAKLDIAEKALANVHAENEFLLSAKESHKERMGKLKLLLNEIEEDDWKFKSVSKLIGIWSEFMGAFLCKLNGVVLLYCRMN